jgi:hypothetical protein
MTLPACIRGPIEQPPDTRYYDPGLRPTHSIAALKSMNGLYLPGTGGDTTLIDSDILISGIVVADDRSGNFYKQIVIQDSTAALFVNIDDYSLYARYPVGRHVYVRCKGLLLGYNGGMIELGSGIDQQLNVLGLSVAQAEEHIIKGAIGNAVPDTIVSLDQVRSITSGSANRALLGRLITIQGVQFEDSAQTYSDPAATSNRTITNCAGSDSRMVVRTSNFASFRGCAVGKGQGKIRGIYTVYQSATASTPQLIIRDTSDVHMYDQRCGTLPEVPLIRIDSLRKMYPGSGTFVLPALQCSGTVISDLSKGNASTGNFILQDGSGCGFILYLSGGTFQLGDSLVLDASGAKLQLYNGALEMTGMTSSKITRVASKKTVVPIQRTIAQLNADFAKYESVLVKIVSAEIKSGGTYSGNKTLDDGTGSISLYTASSATFAGSIVPTGKISVIGIGTRYTYNEIKIRDPVIDVQ